MDANTRLAPRPGRAAERLVLWPVLSAGLLLTLIHVAITLVWRLRHLVCPELRPLLLVNCDFSIFSWLTVGTTFLFAASCFVVAALLGRRGLYATGGVFLYLSMDDAVTLHERIGWLAQPALGGHEVYAWLLVYGPGLALAGLVSFVALWRTFAGDARARRRVVAAYLAFGAALALEMIEKRLMRADIRLREFSLDRYTVPVEEYLELLAPALLLSCSARMLERILTLRKAAPLPAAGRGVEPPAP